MALKPELEELLATITDEKDREVQRGLLEKHQSLRESHLRQSDYDRKMNETKTDREKEQITLTAAKERAEKWDKWAKDNVPRHDNLMAEFKKVSERNIVLEEEVKKAVASTATGGGGGEVDEGKLRTAVLEEVSKRGYMSAADVEKVAVEQARKLAEQERNSFFKDTLPNVLEWTQTMMEIGIEHRQEFGEAFDRKGFSQFIADKKITDLQEGYKMFVGDRRTENKIKTETEKRVKDELSKRNVPGMGALPSPAELGPLQARRAGKSGDGLPDDATISAASMAAAAELRSEGKG